MRIIRPGTSGLTESLQASIDRMSKEYDKAGAAKKKALQDGLSARNQRISSFRRANMRKMEKLRSTKRESVMDKANVYLAEYGKKHGHGIIFGTAAGGSILYGDEDRFDITGEVPARFMHGLDSLLEELVTGVFCDRMTGADSPCFRSALW